MRILDADDQRLYGALTRLGTELTELTEVETEVGRLETERLRLATARDGAGGARIAELERLIADEQGRRDERHTKADRYAALLADASLPAVADAVGFAATQQRALAEIADLDAEAEDVDNARSEASVQGARVDEQSNAIRDESPTTWAVGWSTTGSARVLCAPRRAGPARSPTMATPPGCSPTYWRSNRARSANGSPASWVAGPTRVRRDDRGVPHRAVRGHPGWAGAGRWPA